MKRILTALMIIVLVFAVIPICGQAEEPLASVPCGENASWTLSESGVLTISGSGRVDSWAWGCDPNLVKTVVIEPGITELWQPNFGNCSELTSVFLPNTLETIGSNVFAGCTALTSISFPSSLEMIYNGAFSGCTGLTEITLPLCLRYLGDSAFLGCTGLRTITFESAVAPNSYSNNVFQGVTATVYYIATRGWEYLQNNSGGNLQWIAIGQQPEGVQIYHYQTENYVGGFFELAAYMVPSYLGGEFEIVVDCDVLTLESTTTTAGYSFNLTAAKPGVATVTVTEKNTGYSASLQLTVKEQPQITCPFTDSFSFMPGVIYREYAFTPEESGIYTISFTRSNRYGFQDPHLSVFYTKAGEPNCWLDAEVYGLPDGDWRNCSYYMEAGVTYRIHLETDDNTFDSDRSQEPIPISFRLEKTEPTSGIQIVGDSTVLGLNGVSLYSKPYFVKLRSGNEAIRSGDVIWEVSNPELMEISYDNPSDAYVLTTYGEGSAVLTAHWNGFSDSIKITTQKPNALQLNTPVQLVASFPDGNVHTFTPKESGNYTFSVTGIDDAWVQHGDWSLQGDGSEVLLGELVNGVQSNKTYALTAGVTYRLYFHPGTNPVYEPMLICSVEEANISATSLDIYCRYILEDNYATYTVRCFPEGAHDTIVSWESSNPNILRFEDWGVSSAMNASIYGSGDVTITVVTQNGLRASRTVTIGSCGNGHDFGDWIALSHNSCSVFGIQAARCSRCAFEKYQKISANDHSYDNSCDSSCNNCGQSREIVHHASGEWKQDKTAHWHTCLDCYANIAYQNHIPGAVATATTPQVCTVCDYVLAPAIEPVHRHTAGAEWNIDETSHWNRCDGCEEKLNFSAHTLKNNSCSICGYTLPDEPTAPTETDDPPSVIPPTQEDQGGSPWGAVVICIFVGAVIGLVVVLVGLFRGKAKK